MKKTKGRKNGYQTSMDFHCALSTQTSAANVWSLNIIPAILPGRVATESDVWGLFRITRFRFRIKAATLLAVAGVVASRPNTLPSTQSDVGELLDSVPDLGALTFVWSSWVNVSPVTLRGPNPWYHTRQGTYDITEYVPAVLCGWTSGATDVTYLEYAGTIVLSEPMATNQTPLLLDLRMKIRKEEERMAQEAARDKMLRILGTSTLK